MPKRCAVYNCRGKYNGQPYSSLVSFPKDNGQPYSSLVSFPKDNGQPYSSLVSFPKDNGQPYSSLVSFPKDNGQPYSSLVSFPIDTDTMNLWIDSMPNDRSTQGNQIEIWICASHFDCQWITVEGGKRPPNPPTLFHGVPKSFLMKQVQNNKTSYS